MEKLNIVASPLPFSNYQMKAEAAFGSSLQEIVNLCVPERYNGIVGVIVLIEGHIVPQDKWKLVRPKKGVLVNLRVVPAGGRGGGKNPLAAVLSIAVLVAAPYLAGFIAPSLAAGYAAGTLTLGQTAAFAAIRGAITIVGMMAVNSIAPPPKQSADYSSYAFGSVSSGVANPTESPTLFIEGARNSFSPFSPVPVCLGTNRMFPMQAAKAFTETQNNNQYVRQLFTYGFGKIVTSDRKIGETLLSEFRDVEVETFYDKNLDDGGSLWTNSVIQEDFSILLRQVDSWSTRTVAPACDEVIIDIQFPQGLYRLDDQAIRRSQSVQVSSEWRAIGDVSWNPGVSNVETASSAEAVMRSHRIVFPSNGNYEVRVSRITGDTADTRIIDRTYWSSLKGIRYETPVVAKGLSGIAIRIKASDQLNGAIDQLNEIVSNIIPDYNPDTGLWEEAVTSNPASLYRYILQGEPNARPLPDERIDIAVLEEWWVYCNERGYTCDIVIDYATSVDDVLNLVASAGSASPAIIDGKRAVVIDRADKDIVQIVTPRNSWGYSGEMIYPNMPHAFRVTFRNKDNGYLLDERIVYADGYNESTATLFEELELKHCTNAELAWKHARRYLATAILRPETHSFNLDVEHITFLRGDRIKFQHDVPLIGVGNGRIKEIILDSSGEAISLVLDDTINFPLSGTFYIRIRYSDLAQNYLPIMGVTGSTNTINMVNPIPVADIPELGDLVAVTTAGGELDLVVNRITPSKDLTAQVVCFNYAPEIFDSETGAIPSFNSNITVPLEFQRPLPPILLSAQSDEGVMIRNIDGSYTSVAVFTLENLNEGEILVDVQVRQPGDNVFIHAKVIESTPQKVVITGLDDGLRYDIHIRYKRIGGTVFSIPLQINNYFFVGRFGPPDDVENFMINVSGQMALLSWSPNDDIDLSHYQIRFSSNKIDATWGTSQVLLDNITGTRVSVIAQSGTYLIKAFDLTGNESVNETVITASGLGDIMNAIAILEEDPDFSGVNDNTITRNNLLMLDDSALGSGYYYFDNSIDLTAVFTSYLSSTVIANGMFTNNIFTIDDIFAIPDLFGAGVNDIFTMSDMFSVNDIFGIGTDAWLVRLEMRTSNDMITWTDWFPFVAGSHEFRGAEFRLYLETKEINITPFITKLAVTIDMPDRIERGEDLTALSSGATITFNPFFKDVPALSILLQDGDAGDEIEFISKDEEGFEFRVFNRVSMTYVSRSYDFIATGYGWVIDG